MTDATVFAPPSIEQPASWRRSGTLVGLVALVMTSILGWMVWDRVSLLKNGREIVLPVTPVDPRSLFRGDYVILGYAITQAPAPSEPGPDVRNRDHLYVTLERQADDTWKALATNLRHPGTVPENRVVLQGRLTRDRWISSQGAAIPIQVRYGIESFFVPEGKGRDLEKLVRDKKISARIAVDAKGRAAIKGLLADGKPIHDEPLL
jgi:uncharacterized membrane-anchored protein